MFDIEQISRADLESLQLERLKKIVAWAYEKSSFYQKSFRSHGVAPEDIQTLADIDKLPLLTREEIFSVDAQEFLTLPLSSVVRVSELGGLKKFYTRGDIRNAVELMARSLLAMKILRGTTVGLAGDLSDSRLLDVLYALESIGATVVLGGEKIFDCDVIISARPFGLSVVKKFSEQKVFELFAPPEIGHAGLLCPCEFGCHVQEDNFLIEILDGQLVLTTLTAQALPLIRYATGHAAEKFFEPCACGRTFARIRIE